MPRVAHGRPRDNLSTGIITESGYSLLRWLACVEYTMSVYVVRQDSRPDQSMKQGHPLAGGLRTPSLYRRPKRLGGLMLFTPLQAANGLPLQGRSTARPR